MEIPNISTAIDFLKYPSAILFFLCLFVYWRTGSSHIILDRIWGFISKNKNLGDKTIEKFNHCQFLINNFRFMHGIKVESMAESKKIIQWIDDYHLYAKDVSTAGSYVRFDKPIITCNPPRVVGIFILVMLLVFGLLGVLGIDFTFRNDALITINASGNFYSVGEKKASSYGKYKNKTFSLEKCNNYDAIAKESKIPALDVSVICEYRADKGFADFNKENIAVQKQVGLILLITAIVLFLLLRSELKAFSSARRIAKKISQPLPEPPPAPTPTPELAPTGPKRKKQTRARQQSLDIDC